MCFKNIKCFIHKSNNMEHYHTKLTGQAKLTLFGRIPDISRQAYDRFGRIPDKSGRSGLLTFCSVYTLIPVFKSSIGSCKNRNKYAMKRNQFFFMF